MTDVQTGAGAGSGDGGPAAAAAASGNGGGLDWLPGVDADTAKFITDATIKDLPSLAKTFVEQKRTLSQPRGFEMPKEGDAEGLKKFHAAIGVPETADKYDFGEPGKTMTDEAKKLWAGELHKLGIPAKAAQGLVATVAAQAQAYQKAQDEAFAARSEKAFTDLKTEWGEQFDAKFDLAQRGLRKVAERLEKVGAKITPEVTKGLEQALGTRGLYELSLILGETQIEAPVVMADGMSKNLTKEQAQQQLTAMLKDATIAKALTNRMDPNHARYVDQKKALEQRAWG